MRNVCNNFWLWSVGRHLDPFGFLELLDNRRWFNGCFDTRFNARFHNGRWSHFDDRCRRGHGFLNDLFDNGLLDLLRGGHVDDLFRFSPWRWGNRGFGSSGRDLNPFDDTIFDNVSLLGFERTELVLDVVTEFLAMVKDDLVINFQALGENVDSRFFGCLVYACGQAMLLRSVLDTPIHPR